MAGEHWEPSAEAWGTRRAPLRRLSADPGRCALGGPSDQRRLRDGRSGRSGRGGRDGRRRGEPSSGGGGVG